MNIGFDLVHFKNDDNALHRAMSCIQRGLTPTDRRYIETNSLARTGLLLVHQVMGDAFLWDAWRYHTYVALEWLTSLGQLFVEARSEGYLNHGRIKQCNLPTSIILTLCLRVWDDIFEGEPLSIHAALYAVRGFHDHRLLTGDEQSLLANEIEFVVRNSIVNGVYVSYWSTRPVIFYQDEDRLRKEISVVPIDGLGA